MALNDVPTLFLDLGAQSGRLQPENYTPVDGDYAFVIGSDAPDRYIDISIGAFAGLKRDEDLTSVTLITFALRFRQTQGESAGARRGLLGSYPMAFVDGDDIKLEVDGGSEQALSFLDTDNTLEEIVDACNATLTDAVASADNGQLKFTSNTLGTGSSIEITGGSVYTDLGHTLGATSGVRVRFKFKFLVGGTEEFSFTPDVDTITTYVKRSVNVESYSGTQTLGFALEAVA